MKIDLQMNLDEVLRDIDRSVKILESEKRNALEKIGWVVEEQVVWNIDTKKVIDTGKFKQSVHHKVGPGTITLKTGENITHTGIDEDTVVVADGVHYGVYTEYGTVRMGPRPTFRPAPEQKKHEIQLILREMVENSMR